jgi:ribonucleoside-diphosphate reductase alpha chain
MLIDLDEIHYDLELKRAAAAPLSGDPGSGLDVSATLAGDELPELVLVEDDGGERRLTTADIARPFADALTTFERALLRAEQQRAMAQPRPLPPPIPVLGSDGAELAWTGEDLRRRITFARAGLDLGLDDDALERELRRAIRPGVAREDLRQLIVLNAKALVERDSDYARFAGRILLTFVYEETLGWDIVRDGVGVLAERHRRALGEIPAHGVRIGRIDERLLDYELEPLAVALNPDADLELDFLALQTLYDRYLIVDKTGERPQRIEAPQLFWMRVAMGVCLGEPADGGRPREERVAELYAMYRERRFCSSTPTLFNAGTPHSQLSSCYLYTVEDTLASIVGRGIAENAMCSKWGGRTRRLVDRRARDRLPHRVDQRREPGRRPVPEAP